MMSETYEDTLLGTGHIANWPGTWSHGTRIIRSSATGEIVDVFPPLMVSLSGLDTSGNPTSETVNVGTEPAYSAKSYSTLTAPEAPPESEAAL